MTRKYKVERTHFIGCQNISYMDATCRCLNCGAEIDGPKRGSIIEGEDEYYACIAALKVWETRKGGA